MFGSIKSLIALPALRLGPWNKPGGDERKEGERLLEKSDYAGAELHLAQAIVESEQRQESADKRILLRLELAEAQRKQYHDGAYPQKLADAEETVRSAFDLASRTANHELAVQSLDASAAIATDRGDLDEACRLVEEAGAMEARLKHRDPMQSARRSHRLGLMRQQQGRLPEAVGLLAGDAAIYGESLGRRSRGEGARLERLGPVPFRLGNPRG